ncbi:MAG: DUF4360 domain-containing protein [Candidatus Electrothrix sp. AS4_5]|nr:DUF4360 domain-containing protein [Candidatus Electrothrix gigas]
MKKVTVLIVAVIGIALVGIEADIVNAADERPVYFKTPIKFKGTGCPTGSYTVSGEHTDTITIMFDQYDAAKPKDNAASRMMRTACNFVVPVHVSQGLQVSTITAVWKGYSEGKTKLHREYFLLGPRRALIDIPEGDYILRDNLTHTWANSCRGGTLPIRISTSVRTVSKPNHISLDKLTFKIKWRKCR